MKSLFIISLLFILFIAPGCDRVDVTNPQLTYKDYIVVRAELRADHLFTGVTFTKTLPVNEAYDIKKAELKDVMVYLKINGLQIVPLHFTENGVYLPLQEFNIRAGDTYELFAEENNNYIYSKTTVPLSPAVSSASLAENKYIQVNVTPLSNEVYGAVWTVLSAGNQIDAANDFQDIAGSNQDSASTITIRTEDLPDKYKSPVFSNSLYIQVYSFDYQYKAYFNTKNSSTPVSNPFVQGGSQVIWNVYGDNVIGLFIGMNVSGYVKVQ